MSSQEICHEDFSIYGHQAASDIPVDNYGGISQHFIKWVMFIQAITDKIVNGPSYRVKMQIIPVKDIISDAQNFTNKYTFIQICVNFICIDSFR